MNFKICYVLTSTGSDNYLEEAYVSMYSAKQHNPDAHIVLVTDDRTNETLRGLRKEETKYADEVVIVPLNPKYNAKQRSRLLKTTLRETVNGDFLYIDTDTIVAQPLNGLDGIVKDDIACVYDLHSSRCRDSVAYKHSLRRCRRMGWTLPPDTHYFNGGVMFARDTDTVHKFYKLWNENLLACFGKGITEDQPALYRTDCLMGQIIQPLDGVWNCQVRYGLQFFMNAKVIHYFGSHLAGGKPLFFLSNKNVTDTIKRTGVIGDDVKMVVDNPLAGLAQCVIVIAGEDVQFMRSRVYRFFRHRFHNPFYDILRIIKGINKLRRR